MALLNRHPSTQSRRGVTSWYRSGGLSSIIFALPLVLTFLYFSWGPIVRGLVLSFQKTNLVTTLYFALLALLFGFPVPLFLAVFISELRTTGWLYNVFSYLPAVVPPVVAILLWKFFYDPGGSGLFNTVLGWFGLGPFAWLNSSNLAMPAIVLEATWAGAGATAIIYLAALTGVRNELYEAAELDGAGIWRRVWHVTIPQIRGIIVIMMLLQLIGTFQVFTEPFLFTGGGPDNATTTILLLIYRYAFINGDFGAATALSVLLALVLCVLSVVYHFLTRRWSTT